MRAPLNSALAWIAEPFIFAGRVHRPLLAVFIWINGLVLVNAVLHEPTIGYDTRAHFGYIVGLSEGHFPTPENSHGWYWPPAPYAVPALAYRLFLSELRPMGIWWTGKIFQATNVLASLCLTFFLIKLCRLLAPKREMVPLCALATLALLPVYFKTFAFVRGEPLLAALYVVSAYFFLRIVVGGLDRWYAYAGMGILLGVLLLSRQWGFFVLPAMGLVALVYGLCHRPHAKRLLKGALICLSVTAIIASPFYLHLRSSKGKVTAFNREAMPFSLANQPRSFYFNWSLDTLFTAPLRKAFPNYLVPKLYSEMWGDYECYFVVYGRTAEGGYVSGGWLEERFADGQVPKDLLSNYQSIGAYLGRVNALGVLPTLLLLVALAAAIKQLWRERHLARADGMAPWGNALLLLIVLITACGYGWFLIKFPNLEKGDTIKATYILHIFPFLAVLLAAWAERMGLSGKQWPVRFVLGWVTLAAIHNLPACVTRYINF